MSATRECLVSNVVVPLSPRLRRIETLKASPHERHVSIQEWLTDRKPEFLSTNTGSNLAAFQTWRNFKEAFAPELIAQAYEETSEAIGRPVSTSIDPFGGSGTTALSSQFLGVNPTTVEVNPYLADLIEAKLDSYNTDRLLLDYQKVLSTFVDVHKDHFPCAPDTFVEPGRKGRYELVPGLISPSQPQRRRHSVFGPKS